MPYVVNGHDLTASVFLCEAFTSRPLQNDHSRLTRDGSLFRHSGPGPPSESLPPAAAPNYCDLMYIIKSGA
eukprot:388953-Hanusia_phi.AAC.1